MSRGRRGLPGVRDTRWTESGLTRAQIGTRKARSMQGDDRTHAEQEAELITRKVSMECDGFHHDAADSGCTNTSCQC